MKKLLGLVCAVNLVCLSLSAPSLAIDPSIPPFDGSSPIQVKDGNFNRDALSVILSNLSLPQMRGTREVCSDFRDAMPQANRFRVEKLISELDKHFVTIPEGRLPNGTQIASFQADKYPVTQSLWQEIMGSLPQGVQANCPHCPVTHVNWENQDGSAAEVQDFLARLNQKTAKLGCTYDLPNDSQLHYMIRADRTGTNQDKYSTGVTNQNVGDYVTHSGNSNPDGTGRKIQSVDGKKLNAFGIELGNVWKMSKDLYDPAQPTWGRSVRGGSWSNVVSIAGSDFRGFAFAGSRVDDMGLALVRTCH